MTPERLEEIRKWAREECEAYDDHETETPPWEAEKCLELLAYVDELRDLQLLNFMEVRSGLQGQLDEARALVEFAEKRGYALREKEHAADRALYHRLREENGALRAQLDEARAEIMINAANWDGERNQLKATIDKIKAGRDALKAEMRSLKDPSDGRCMEIGALRAYVDKLKAENDELRERNFNANEFSTHFKSENQRLRDRIEKYKELFSECLERDWDWDMISNQSGMRRIQEFRGKVECLAQDDEAAK